MQAKLPQTEAGSVSMARIDVGKLALGQISVGHLIVSDTAVQITAGQALLRNVRVTLRLDFELVWSIHVPLPHELRGGLAVRRFRYH